MKILSLGAAPLDGHPGPALAIFGVRAVGANFDRPPSTEWKGRSFEAVFVRHRESRARRGSCFKICRRPVDAVVRGSETELANAARISPTICSHVSFGIGKGHFATAAINSFRKRRSSRMGGPTVHRTGRRHHSCDATLGTGGARLTKNKERKPCPGRHARHKEEAGGLPAGGRTLPDLRYCRARP